jgi:hypothetical protein
MGLNHATEPSRPVTVSSASFGGMLPGGWRIANRSAAGLAVPLTVAVHALKKPNVYADFINLNTDGHG